MSLSIFEIFTGKHRGPSQIFLGKHLDVQLESWNGFTNISTLKLNKFKPSTDCSPHLHFFLFLMPRKFLIFISRLGALQHTDASWRHLIIVGLFIAAVGGRHHFTVSIWCLHTVYESSIQEPNKQTTWSSFYFGVSWASQSKHSQHTEDCFSFVSTKWQLKISVLVFLAS